MENTLLSSVTCLVLVSLLFMSIIQVNAIQGFNVQVWLAEVNVHTGKVQVCVDVPETGVSSCKKFDASATRKDSVGKEDDPIIVDAGTHTLPASKVLPHSRLVGCVYVFRSDTGYCSEDSTNPTNETHNMMLFTKVMPVYYDKGTDRLYKYGECYLERNNSQFCVEDEGIEFPETSKYNK